MTDKKRLREMLREDFDHDDEALFETVEQLHRWEAPVADPNKTALLIETLMPEMPATQSRWFDRIRDWMPFLLMRAQLRVVQGEIWIASVIVMALGTLVTLASTNTNASTLPLVLVAPLVAAISISYVYGPISDPALEIELTSPVSGRVILLARLSLIFGFDLMLGLLASVVLAAFNAEILLWQVVAAWLAPMALLSALAFLLSVLLVDATFGVVFSILLWAFHSLRHFDSFRFLGYLPDFTLPHMQLVALLLALVLGAVALWLAEREENWIQE